MRISGFLFVLSGLVPAIAVLAAGQAVASGQSPVGGGQFAVEAPQLAILDTDIGDDIDDAFALALVLKSPELRLLGVTTAFGDTGLRARLAERFLRSTGHLFIPVSSGVPTKADNVFTQSAYALFPDADCEILLRSSYSEDAKRYEECVRSSKKHEAVDFLLREIGWHPGEITLIAIGPLFNIQAAIERDPDTFRKLKRVVMMGGSIYRGYDGRNGERRPPDAEWNISRDPAGLKALLASGVPVFMMPLDSTQIHLETKEREAIFSHGSPLTDQLTLLYHQWLAGTEGHPNAPTLFDPVAVAYAVRPELCPMTPMRLEVDDKGFTRPVDGAPNVQVCLKSDEKGFMELLMGRIAKDEAR